MESEKWKVKNVYGLGFERGKWDVERGNPFFVILNELLGEEESLLRVRGNYIIEKKILFLKLIQTGQ